jgi:osmotically-inducible protein OsmY
MWRIASLLFLCSLTSSCISTLWTGASLVYDRHDTYKKLSDYHLQSEVRQRLFVDERLRCAKCAIEIAVFNGDVLLVGHLPNEMLLTECRRRLHSLTEQRRLINQIRIGSAPYENWKDSWITTKIRTQIVADESIDPHAFKIITSNQVVYLMGDVKPDEAEKVIQIARFTKGVRRVMKVLRYYTYQDKVSR